MTTPPGDWTLDTLRYTLEQRMDLQDRAVQTALAAQEKAVAAALLAAEKAVTKAEMASEKRFESTNEFRGQLNDQATTFVTRTEVEASLARITERVQDLTDRINVSQGRGAGLTAGWGYLIGAVGLVGALVALALLR